MKGTINNSNRIIQNKTKQKSGCVRVAANKRKRGCNRKETGLNGLYNLTREEYILCVLNLKHKRAKSERTRFCCTRRENLLPYDTVFVCV